MTQQLSVSTISNHLKSIFESSELRDKLIGSLSEHTTGQAAAPELAQTVKVKHYNLSAYE